MLSISQLLKPATEDELLASVLTYLGELGLQTTSWQSGSAQLITLRLFCKLYSAWTTWINGTVAGRFPALAAELGQSGWLRLTALYVFDMPYITAVSTIGKFTLTNTPAAPSHLFAAGDIIVSDSPDGTVNARTYTNTQAGNLGPGASLSIEFKANVAGANGNIPPNTPLYLWTPLVGTTATNPPLTPSITWITTVGVDDESDNRLAARMIAKWNSLTYANNEGAYRYWAMQALAALTRVQVAAAAGNGTVTLYGATSVGPIDAGQITTIQNYVNGTVDGVGRRPLNDIFSAVGATTVTSPALTIAAFVLPAVSATIATDMATALLAYIGSIPIGGTVLVGTQGRVPLSKLIDIAMSLTGVKSVVFNITSDVLLNPGEIYVPTITVTPTIVAPTA